MGTAPDPDPVLCPLCSMPNRCAMEVEKATGQPQPACWCTAVNFEPAVLAQLPAASRNLACICAACAARGTRATRAKSIENNKNGKAI